MLKGDEVCYSPFGCFSDDAPFDHYLMTNPQPPSDIETFFTVHTKNETKKFTDFDQETLSNASFLIKQRHLKLVIHGMLESSSKSWVNDMTVSLLKKPNVTVLVVDWGRGALSFATGGNARLVGAQVAYLLKYLLEKNLVVDRDIHIVGFSLGAHIAGYAGKRLLKDGFKLGRITGLDPGDLPIGGRIFETADKSARLDLTDAHFVDTIHTDTKGLGIERPIGHLDFYPNGGSDQPGCGIIKTLTALGNVRSQEKFFRTVGCNHIRAVDMFTKSLSTDACKYQGYPCPTYDALKSAKCSKQCGEELCPVMGYDAVFSKGIHKLTGKRLFLETIDCKKPKVPKNKKISTFGQFFDSFVSIFI